MFSGKKDIKVSINALVDEFGYNAESRIFEINESMWGLQHYHSHYEIIYVTESSRVLYINDDKYTLDNSYIALIPPYVFHGSGNGLPTRQTRCLLSFKEDFLKNFSNIFDIDLLSCFSLKYPVINLDTTQQEEVYKLFQKIISLNNVKNNSYTKIKFLLCVCDLLTLCTQIQSKIPPLVLDNPSMAELINYIEKNYFEDITLESLSQQFKINRYKLSRQFKIHTGINMVKYINKVRISHSKEMLANTNQKITNIAGKIGFNNTTHFNRVFKEEVGYSPSEYRTKYRLYVGELPFASL